MDKWGKETGSEISVSFGAGPTPRQTGAMKAEYRLGSLHCSCLCKNYLCLKKQKTFPTTDISATKPEGRESFAF